MKNDGLRKHIRFYPDPLEIALIDTDVERYKSFHTASPEMETQFIALIENESHTGASLVFVIKDGAPEFIKSGTNWIVKMGELVPMRCVVKWNQKIDDVIFKVGIAIIE